MATADPSFDVRPAPPLPRRVLAGYSLGSRVTGSFGTVPGLLLLPYLTDTLGITAGVAGLLVLLPKGVGRPGQSGRRPVSDRYGVGWAGVSGNAAR
jgi:hypothetical protein